MSVVLDANAKPAPAGTELIEDLGNNSKDKDAQI